MRRLSIALACLVFLLGAGCGGGDDEAGGDTETIVTTETTTDETTTDDLDTSGLEGFASEECLELIGVGAALGQAFAGTGSSEAEEASELFAQLVDKAPAEIEADLETIASGYAEYVDAIRDLDLEEGQIPSAADIQQIQAAIASIDQPGLQAASERLSAWAEANCRSS